MARYEVDLAELHFSTVEVEAESLEEAVRIAHGHGQDDPKEIRVEYSDTLTDRLIEVRNLDTGEGEWAFPDNILV